MPSASAVLMWGFVTLSVLLALAFVAAVARAHVGGEHRIVVQPQRVLRVALLTAAWLAFTLGAAALGWLRFDSRPPTMLLLLLCCVLLAIGLASSPVGARLAAGLPLAGLVGFQGFRVLVELLLDRAYHEGFAPVQMTFRGRNFDVITGVTALVVAALLASGQLRGRLARLVVGSWNVMGALLLLNVFVIAVLSTPTPIRTFHNEPANVWIAHAPWVWLPSVMVVAAAMGHVLVYRRLRAMPAG